MALERLLKLIELANNENNPEEARTAAVTACRMFKRDGYRLIDSYGRTDDNWSLRVCSYTFDCSGCQYAVEEYSEYLESRVDGKRYHQGCLP
jgi:hypothetical protein